MKITINVPLILSLIFLGVICNFLWKRVDSSMERTFNEQQLREAERYEKAKEIERKEKERIQAESEKKIQKEFPYYEVFNEEVKAIKNKTEDLVKELVRYCPEIKKFPNFENACRKSIYERIKEKFWNELFATDNGFECPGLYRLGRETRVSEIKKESLTLADLNYVKTVFNIFRRNKSLETASPEILEDLIGRIEIDPKRQDELTYFVYKIVPLANEITFGAKDDYEKVRKIYKWVNANIRYAHELVGVEYKKESDSPLRTIKDILEQKRGICTHFAVLIRALIRASGIPSCIVDIDNLDDIEFALQHNAAIGHALEGVYINRKWKIIASTGSYSELKDQKLGLPFLDFSESNKSNNVFNLYFLGSNYTSNYVLGCNYLVLNMLVNKYTTYLGKSSAKVIKKAKDLLAKWRTERDLFARDRIGKEILKVCLRYYISQKERIPENQILIGEDEQILKKVKEAEWHENEDFVGELKRFKVICLFGGGYFVDSSFTHSRIDPNYVTPTICFPNYFDDLYRSGIKIYRFWITVQKSTSGKPKIDLLLVSPEEIDKKKGYLKTRLN